MLRTLETVHLVHGPPRHDIPTVTTPDHDFSPLVLRHLTLQENQLQAFPEKYKDVLSQKKKALRLTHFFFKHRSGQKSHPFTFLTVGRTLL